MKPEIKPAFPLLELNAVTGDVCFQHFGMTMRDYFAAMAMQALISSRHESFAQWDTFADFSFKIADSMMEASNK
jgi:hypothetical protein